MLLPPGTRIKFYLDCKDIQLSGAAGIIDRVSGDESGNPIYYIKLTPPIELMFKTVYSAYSTKDNFAILEMGKYVCECGATKCNLPFHSNWCPVKVDVFK